MQLERLVEKVGPQGLERVHHRQKLQQVGRVGALGQRQFARLEGDRVEGTRVVRLLQNGRDSQLRGVGEQARRARRVPHAKHRG